jgi:hypothetical protein
MGILRTIVILAIVSVLVVAGAGSAFAKGPPEGDPPYGQANSNAKQGLFGTVMSTAEITADEVYEINLETKKYEEEVTVTINLDTTYKVPRVTKGPKADLATFIGIIGSIDALEGERVAVLVNSDFEAKRLMLIPSGPPMHAHRVGIVTEFTPAESPDGSITIIDNKGMSHTFVITEETVYRPSAEDGGISDLEPEALSEALEGGFVTVVTTGDPKADPPPTVKAVVLHEELPEWSLGKIIVDKVTDPEGDPQIFYFSLEGGPDTIVEAFELDDDDDPYNSGWLKPGVYTVGESLPLEADWSIDSIEETSGDTSDVDIVAGTATIDLVMGETVTVTFTNLYTDPAP